MLLLYTIQKCIYIIISIFDLLVNMLKNSVKIHLSRSNCTTYVVALIVAVILHKCPSTDGVSLHVGIIQTAYFICGKETKN